MLEARRCFLKAVELDPNCAEALGWCAWTYILDIVMGWTDANTESVALAYAVSRRAIKIDPDSEMGHWGLGATYLIDNQYDKGFAEYDKALEINPSNPDLMVTKGTELADCGRYDEGLALIQKGFDFNKHPPEWYYWHLGIAYFAADRHLQVIDSFEKMSEQNKDSLTYLAASYAIMENYEEARNRLQELLELDPEFRIEQIRKTHFYHTEKTLLRLINGLQLAMRGSKAASTLHVV